MTGSGYRPSGPGPDHPPARPPNVASGGMDPSHLRAEVDRLRRRVGELLDANGRLKDERTQARAIAIALERELELLREDYGRRVLGANPDHADPDPGDCA